MNRRYILKGHKPVPAPNLLRWGKWLEEADRHVALTIQEDIRVSTVFLGLDHSFGHGPPVLFETMVFKGEESLDCERYSTWDEAEAGHKRWVAKTFSRSLAPSP